MPIWQTLTLRAGRDSLVKFIKENNLEGSQRNKVTIVFDGKSEVLDSFLKDNKIEIIFTKGQSADDKIKNLVRLSKNPKEIVVISEDKDIKFSVRSYGAKVLTIKEFFKKDISNGHKPIEKTQKPELTLMQMQKINEELKKIWFKK